MTAAHAFLLLGAMILTTIAGAAAPKWQSLSKGRLYGLAYWGALLFVFAGLQSLFGHRAALFAAIVSGAVGIIVLLPVAAIADSGVSMPWWLSGWRKPLILLLVTPLEMLVLAAAWSLAH